MASLGHVGLASGKEELLLTHFLKVRKLIDCIYWWSRNLKQADTCVETAMSRKSVLSGRNAFVTFAGSSSADGWSRSDS